MIYQRLCRDIDNPLGAEGGDGAREERERRVSAAARAAFPNRRARLKLKEAGHGETV